MPTYLMASLTVAGLESMTFTDRKSGLYFFFFWQTFSVPVQAEEQAVIKGALCRR